MKQIVFLILTLGFSGAMAQETGKKVKDFLSITNLKEGDYTLRTGTDSCLSGELSIVKTDASFQVVLGSRSLIIGLGVKEESESTLSCKTVFKASYSKHRVRSSSVDKCGKNVSTSNIDLQTQDDGFTYVQTIRENGKLTSRVSCTLKLEK